MVMAAVDVELTGLQVDDDRLRPLAPGRFKGRQRKAVGAAVAAVDRIAVDDDRRDAVLACRAVKARGDDQARRPVDHIATLPRRPAGGAFGDQVERQHIAVPLARQHIVFEIDRRRPTIAAIAAGSGRARRPYPLIDHHS